MDVHKYVYGGAYDIQHISVADTVYCVTKSPGERSRKLPSILASAANEPYDPRQHKSSSWTHFPRLLKKEIEFADHWGLSLNIFLTPGLYLEFLKQEISHF